MPLTPSRPVPEPFNTRWAVGDLNLKQNPTIHIGVAFLLGAATAVCAGRIHRRYFRRFPNGNWLTPDAMDGKRWIKGVVTSVGDSDNFRLYHTPGIGWRWPFKFRSIPSNPKALKDQTLHIRVAGVDAPEGAHFGRPAQAYAVESLEWFKAKIEGRTVYCRPVLRDQYYRIVSVVHLSHPRLPMTTNLSLEMLRAGWATTYEQTNAEYGTSSKDEFLRTEEEAKQNKRGMWKLGRNLETPAEFKKRYASGEGGGTSTTTANAKALKNDKSSIPKQEQKRSGWLW